MGIYSPYDVFFKILKKLFIFSKLCYNYQRLKYKKNNMGIEDMDLKKDRFEYLEKELEFIFTRSSGHGGQNVNKVSSKVQIRWDISNSLIFNPEEKIRIKEYLKNNISKEGYVFLDSEKYKEQIKNRGAVVNKLKELIKESLIPKKSRRKTKPSFTSKEKRMKEKKEVSYKKHNRRIS